MSSKVSKEIHFFIIFWNKITYFCNWKLCNLNNLEAAKVCLCVKTYTFLAKCTMLNHTNHTHFELKSSITKNLNQRACMPTLLDISGSLPDMTPIPSLRYRFLYVQDKIIFWAAIKWNSKPAYPAKSRMKLHEGQKSTIFHPWFGGEGGPRFSIYFVQHSSFSVP